MPATYEPIATNTLSSSASSITFSSIPSTYTDLKLIFSGLSSASTQATLKFNSDNNAFYSYTVLQGNGTSASGDITGGLTEMYPTYQNLNSTTPRGFIADIFSYTSSSSKTCLIQSVMDTVAVLRQVSMYRSANTISSLTILNSNSFLAGTTASLYGIKAA